LIGCASTQLPKSIFEVNRLEDDRSTLTFSRSNSWIGSACIIDLYINEKKTVGNSNVSHMLSVKEGPIKEVEDFKYLGSWIIKSRKDISVRTAIAWKALKQLKTVWKSHLSKDFKLYVFNTLIQSILLYSCETWSLTQTLEKKLDGTRNLMVRYALKISWKGHIAKSIIFTGIGSYLSPYQR
jgi:hypothetical protein